MYFLITFHGYLTFALANQSTSWSEKDLILKSFAFVQIVITV